MSKLTKRERELIEEYGPGAPPQPGTLFFSDYDPFERLPEHPKDRDDLAEARLRHWLSEWQTKNRKPEARETERNSGMTPFGQGIVQRFTEKQRHTRNWINFGEIADAYSRELSIRPDETARAAAFDALASDLLAGEFEENGRSLVLFLHPTREKHRLPQLPSHLVQRMTRPWLRDAIEHNYDGNRGRSQYLPKCWIPRRLFDRWRTKYSQPESLRRFEPRVQTGLARARERGSGGRPDAYDWVALKELLFDYVKKNKRFAEKADLVKWCIQNVQLRSGALQPKGDGPDPKTVKAAINRHSLDKIGIATRG